MASIIAEEGLGLAIDRVAQLAAPASRFLTRSWFAAAGGRNISTISLEAGGDARIAIPIARVNSLLAKVPGCYWPFRSFAVAAAATADDMAELLRSPIARRALGPAWRVGPIYANDPALALLRAAAPRSGWIVAERRIATSFLLDMAALSADGWPRNSTLRKNRFHEKHLAAHGALRWRFVRGADWTPDIFADLAAIEAKSWHAGSSDPKFLPGPHCAFWRGLARDPEQAARMNAAILYVDGAPAAFSFDLDVGATKYAIANSYDPAFAKHSPGKCLYYRNLADAVTRGIEIVDWGAGDGGYKQTIGALPGPEILDCLIIRSGWAGPPAHLLGRFWRNSGNTGRAR